VTLVASGVARTSGHKSKSRASVHFPLARIAPSRCLQLASCAGVRRSRRVAAKNDSPSPLRSASHLLRRRSPAPAATPGTCRTARARRSWSDPEISGSTKRDRRARLVDRKERSTKLDRTDTRMPPSSSMWLAFTSEDPQVAGFFPRGFAGVLAPTRLPFAFLPACPGICGFAGTGSGRRRRRSPVALVNAEDDFITVIITVPNNRRRSSAGSRALEVRQTTPVSAAQLRLPREGRNTAWISSGKERPGRKRVLPTLPADAPARPQHTTQSSITRRLLGEVLPPPSAGRSYSFAGMFVRRRR